MSESAKGATRIPKDIAALSFEQAMGELESIVRELEQGTVELDRAVGAYERGVALKRHCDVKLRDARMTVERISVAPDGTPSTSPLDGV
ncbi:exodeoxyribonuclease VII small subunit [Rhodospirillum sp. A1_3_36]|uniref:exodeoxyribonuclease VII small subunit n=1 Tax=Rhodospirillum sp. A1_3_36 TaxID=3391666 RepID=UPI0039A4CC06